MIDYKLSDEILNILEKIHKGLIIDYQGNFINEDYMFELELKDFNYCEDITIKKNKCIDEADARIYLVVTFFIECIAECRLFKNITNYDLQGFKKWLWYIGDEDCEDDEAMEALYYGEDDIFATFEECLDKVNFARTILNKEELFKFGEFVNNSSRYKSVVKSKVNAVKKCLKNF